jgi:hypothetical protein
MILIIVKSVRHVVNVKPMTCVTLWHIVTPCHQKVKNKMLKSVNMPILEGYRCGTLTPLCRRKSPYSLDPLITAESKGRGTYTWVFLVVLRYFTQRQNNSFRCLLRCFPRLQDMCTASKRTRCTLHLDGHPSKYYPGLTLLDIGDQLGTGDQMDSVTIRAENCLS